MGKLITVQLLQDVITKYHDMLIQQLQAGKLVQINACPNCGGFISAEDFSPVKIVKCQFCRGKFKVEFDADKKVRLEA